MLFFAVFKVIFILQFTYCNINFFWKLNKKYTLVLSAGFEPFHNLSCGRSHFSMCSLALDKFTLQRFFGLVLLFVGLFLNQSSWSEWHWSEGKCVNLYNMLVGWVNPLDISKKTALTGRSCLDFACQCAGAENFMERFSVLYGDKIFVRTTAWSSQRMTTIISCCFLTQLSEGVS